MIKFRKSFLETQAEEMKLMEMFGTLHQAREYKRLEKERNRELNLDVAKYVSKVLLTGIGIAAGVGLGAGGLEYWKDFDKTLTPQNIGLITGGATFTVESVVYLLNGLCEATRDCGY